jgi:hypothetical protein
MDTFGVSPRGDPRRQVTVMVTSTYFLSILISCPITNDESLQYNSLSKFIIRLLAPTISNSTCISHHHFITPILNHIQVKPRVFGCLPCDLQQRLALPIRRNIYPCYGAEAIPNPQDRTNILPSDVQRSLDRSCRFHHSYCIAARSFR